MASSYFFFFRSLMPSSAKTSGGLSSVLFLPNQPLTVLQLLMKATITSIRKQLAMVLGVIYSPSLNSFQVSLHRDGGDGAIPHGCAYLPLELGPHIARGEDARDIGCHDL